MKITKLLTVFFVLVALMLTAKAALGADTDMVINEIMVDPSEGNQWIELYNTGSSPVNLNGWILRTEGSDTILSGIVNAQDRIIIELEDKISTNGDKVAIKNPGTTIDGITFGETTTYPSLEDIDDTPGKNEVLARIHDAESWLEEAHSEATKGTGNNRVPTAEDVPIQQLTEIAEEIVYVDRINQNA